MKLDQEIRLAVLKWIIVQMAEMRGPGEQRFQDRIPTYTFGDVLDVINEVAPDAVARMLQAGAADYLDAVEVES